jgi:hypothetical protein
MSENPNPLLPWPDPKRCRYANRAPLIPIYIVWHIVHVLIFSKIGRNQNEPARAKTKRVANKSQSFVIRWDLAKAAA